MSAVERTFTVNGYQLAAKEWNKGAELKVIASHGWLDNAASFDALAPLLGRCHILALDMPGHGLSDHKSPQASYNIWDDLLDILAIADDMEWQTFNLLGHSRGAIISLMLSAAMPERIQALVMLDAVLPLPVDIAETPKQLNKFLVERRRALHKKLPRYASIDEAVAARCKAANMNQQSARTIVERGLVARDGSYHWTTDVRLTTASAFKMTAEHNKALVESITTPNLLLLAEGGLGARKEFINIAESYGTLHCQTLPGSHHFHMEEQAGDIAAIVETFFLQQK
ncbi:alpha/beta fold hydrolase [Oceanicoccus sagamiensis]|uniref:AB hydrolase-1 domain-containing protein n=1 Tax=Oceanicoccus sagamiensis TaxID=716816 RepID=A0A1X9NJV5_9GAMM|nr:alpha/beta hydrolase [Oceanicoccus sagamiensis]ARN76115.1 hypothetical protein BST96_19645 [Oceanicoccus sagamiensis]